MPESIIGGIFRARLVAETTVGSLAAGVPEVSGSAKSIRMNQLFIDPDDDLKHGFLLSYPGIFSETPPNVASSQVMR